MIKLFSWKYRKKLVIKLFQFYLVGIVKLVIKLFQFYLGDILIFREFNPEIHDVYKVAELVYDVDERTFANIFSSREEGIEAIKERLLYDFSLEGDENELYYVFFDDDDVEEENIIGMFNGGKGVTHNYFRYSLSLFHHMKFSQAWGLAKVNFLDSFVLVDVEKDDFYICELAVLSSCRGRGYGKEALTQLIQLARDLDCKRVVLDADFRNDGAFRLYSSFGFEVFNEKCFKHLGIKRGMRNMELILKD